MIEIFHKRKKFIVDTNIFIVYINTFMNRKCFFNTNIFIKEKKCIVDTNIFINSKKVYC